LTLLSLSSISIRYGAEPLLSDVNLTVAKGERWGIVGRNGSGKTSLFRLITGGLDPAEGAVFRAPGLRVAVLDQHRDFAGASTVWDAACAGFAALLRLEQSLAEQGEALAALGERVAPEHLDRYDRDLERFRREGGYEMESRVSAVLHGLGFDPAAARRQPLATLSGGERGRLGLACQLVTSSDLLLLDEPTNHLDLETTEWLVGHLRALDAAQLIISHDRAFLDAVADHVLHLEGGAAQSYTGGYSAFVEQRAERRLAATRAYHKQARMVAQEEEYIRRNIAGQNSRQAKGRRTRLARVPRLSPPPASESAMAIRFTASGRGGDQVLVAEDLSVAIEGRVLLDRFSGTIRRGDVLGLVGPNGAGKSTLLATLLGERTPARGRVRLGDTIATAEYRQDLGQVPRDRSLFDIIHDLRPAWTRGQVMDHLGRFDFSGDETLRLAGSLSGGELARVALAMMMLDRANFLVFDEPTNHLDVESIEALEDAVLDYEGTVLLVSHDRAMLRALCTRVWALEGGRITEYDGSFGDWELAREERRRQLAAAAREAEAARKAREPKPAKREPDRRATQSAARSARRAVEQAEARVHELEQEVARRTAELADPGLYVEPEGSMRPAKLAAELERVKAELDAAYAAWETAASAAEGVDG
jgi:ATP-binding cassette subfamily F protein 3